MAKHRGHKVGKKRGHKASKKAHVSLMPHPTLKHAGHKKVRKSIRRKKG